MSNLPRVFCLFLITTAKRFGWDGGKWSYFRLVHVLSLLPPSLRLEFESWLCVEFVGAAHGPHVLGSLCCAHSNPIRAFPAPLGHYKAKSAHSGIKAVFKNVHSCTKD